MYAIGRKTLQKWHVLDQGGERLLAEQDVQQVVASSVLQLNDERYSAAQSLAFDLLDGAVQADGKLVLLFSQSKTEHEPLQYGLATLDVVKDAASFVVASIQPIKYTSYADPRPYATPSLSLPNGGPAAFITFADAVVAKQLEDGCESFEELIKLKDDVKNRFIGSGCDAVHVSANNAVAALSLISAASGSLLVETSIDAIRKRCTASATAADRQRADTERLKGKLEQALYYSESPLNPLTFRLPEHLQGTLMTACQDLSRELLTFSNPIAQSVPPPVDLRAALKDRLASCASWWNLWRGAAIWRSCRRRPSVSCARTPSWLRRSQSCGSTRTSSTRPRTRRLRRHRARLPARSRRSWPSRGSASAATMWCAASSATMQT